jgi:hypothetical protein
MSFSGAFQWLRMFAEDRLLFFPAQQIPSVIPNYDGRTNKHGLTCRPQGLRYVHFQIARIWFCRIREIAKVGSVWLGKPLLAPRGG